jgi:hypothetical protein
LNGGDVGGAGGNWGHCTSIFLSLNFPVVFKEFDRNILRQEYWGIANLSN